MFSAMQCLEKCGAPWRKRLIMPAQRVLRQLVPAAVGLTITIAAVIWLSGRRSTYQTEPSQLVSGGETYLTNLPILGTQDDHARLYLAPKKTGQLPVAPYNRIPRHESRTPLFIGFTQNNDILIQAVTSYIAAGWPVEDIIVLDNSGTMDANSRGDLSPQNPFFLDYNQLRNIGVSVLQTSTLLTFAQLQNFYLRTAIAQEWPTFFWSHMDVVVLGDEHETPYRSFYRRVLDVVEQTDGPDDWAVRFFNYDALTMVNVKAWRKIGQWDPFIPYYHADCDAYSRMDMHGYDREATNVKAGTIFDVTSTLKDFEHRLFPAKGEKEPNSTRYQRLRAELQAMDKTKKEDPGGRNTWKSSQQGGGSEPWTLDPKGFRLGWFKISEIGKNIYYNKWASNECGLHAHGKKLSDMYKNVLS